MDGPKKKSKKPSATNSSKPLDDVVFFVDRSLGRKAVPEALRAAGARVEVHDDHPPQNAKDEDWLAYIGKRNWVALTQDARIRHHELEYSLQSFKGLLKEKGKGTARDNINLATFENQKFPFPKLSVQKKIVSVFNDLNEGIQRLESLYQRKLAALDALKKSLLHQAFSGQL